MKIEQFDCFRAKVSYHRTDDLKSGAAPDGSIVSVIALWFADSGEKFTGDWIFSIAQGYLWVPERDLELIERIPREVFIKDRDENNKNSVI